MFRVFVDFFASGFRSGHAPIIPGTFGSAAALILLWILCWRFPLLAMPAGIIMLTAGTFALGIYVAHHAVRLELYGIGVHDPRPVVIDEFAGMFITMLGSSGAWWEWIAGFFLFRLLDITKPPPIRQLESLPGGAGIMADDVAAGLIAAAILAGLRTLAS
ncbi:MAG: phosphatidylglycerophosphatase A [Bdellovibrionales bacterium]|nr:phosphatidylglycerophosphatase A [Bdellovibrionales bacterium]